MFRVVGGMNKRLQKIECKFNTISLLFSTQHVTRRDECQINSWLLLLPGNRFKGCCFFILYFLAKDKNYRQLERYFTLHGELGNWIGATYRKWKKNCLGEKLFQSYEFGRHYIKFAESNSHYWLHMILVVVFFFFSQNKDILFYFPIFSIFLIFLVNAFDNSRMKNVIIYSHIFFYNICNH